MVRATRKRRLLRPPPLRSRHETLVLPDGMPEEFALRLWQEQVDSQENVRKLLSGEVTELDDHGRRDELATSRSLAVEAEFADGTSAPGTVGMRRYGDVWYFAYVTGMRECATDGSRGLRQRGRRRIAGDCPPEHRMRSTWSCSTRCLLSKPQVRRSRNAYANGTIDSVRGSGCPGRRERPELLMWRWLATDSIGIWPGHRPCQQRGDGRDVVRRAVHRYWRRRKLAVRKSQQ